MFFMNMKVSVPNVLKSVKYNLGVVNIIFLLTGLLLLLVGVVVLIIYSEYEDLITRRFFTMPGFVIATGSIIMLTSILGFYGAFSEQFYFIAGYTIMMIVILVFEVAMVIVAFGMEENAASEIQRTMLDSQRQYSSRIEIAQLWDELQRDFECCGVSGRFDYTSNNIPISCCHIDYGVVGTFECVTANAYTTGCSTALGELLSYNAHVIAVSALVATCLQVPLTAIAAWTTYCARYHQVELES